MPLQTPRSQTVTVLQGMSHAPIIEMISTNCCHKEHKRNSYVPFVATTELSKTKGAGLNFPWKLPAPSILLIFAFEIGSGSPLPRISA